MRTRWIIAVVLVLLGIVWIAQGMGWLRGSGFMDGDMRWALIGAILAVGGVVGRLDRVQDAPGLSQPVQVASSRPTVTCSP